MKVLTQDTQAKSSNISLKDSIDKVTISDYERLIFDNDLSILVIAGNPDEEYLRSVMNDILFDFTNACSDGTINPIINQYRRINLYRLHIKQLQLCAQIIPFGAPESVKIALKRIGIHVDIVNKKIVMKAISGKIKQLYIKLSEEIDSYKKKKASDKGTFTRNDHAKQLAYISKEMGFKIDRESTTLREYSSYISFVKSANKQKNGTGK